MRSFAIALLLVLVAGCSSPADGAGPTGGTVQAPPTADDAPPGGDGSAAPPVSRSNHAGGWLQAVSLALPDGSTTTSYSPDGADSFHAPGRTVLIEATLSWPEPPGPHAWRFCLHGPNFDAALHCVHGKSSPLVLVLAGDGSGLNGDYAPEAWAHGDGLPAAAAVSQDLRWEAKVTALA